MKSGKFPLKRKKLLKKSTRLEFPCKLSPVCTHTCKKTYSRLLCKIKNPIQVFFVIKDYLNVLNFEFNLTCSINNLKLFIAKISVLLLFYSETIVLPF